MDFPLFSPSILGYHYFLETPIWRGKILSESRLQKPAFLETWGVAPKTKSSPIMEGFDRYPQRLSSLRHISFQGTFVENGLKIATFFEKMVRKLPRGEVHE